MTAMTETKTPEYPSYLKPNGRKWSFHEVYGCLGEDVVQTANRNVWVAPCPLHEYPKEIELIHSSDVSLEHGFRLECRHCIVQRLGSKEAFHKEITRWLNDLLGIPEDLGGHFNPFDAVSEAPVPSYLPDAEGNHLLYKGAVNIVYGKPGTLKSWLLLSLVAKHDVRYWDFENGSGALAGRLRLLKVPYEQAHHFTTPSSKESVMKRVDEYLEEMPEIVCIDGFSGLAQVLEVDVDSNQEVMSVYGKVLNPLREAGITVVLLDHLPKEGASDDYPIGAQAKKAQADLTLLVKSESRTGDINLYVTKDRHSKVLERSEPGAFPRKLGSLKLIPTDDSLEFEITPVYSASRGGQQLSTEDAYLESSIWSFVDKNPNCSKSDIERNVLGKTERKRKALDELVGLGYIRSERIGTSLAHSVVKPLDLEWEPIS